MMTLCRNCLDFNILIFIIKLLIFYSYFIIITLNIHLAFSVEAELKDYSVHLTVWKWVTVVCFFGEQKNNYKFLDFLCRYSKILKQFFISPNGTRIQIDEYLPIITQNQILQWKLK